MDELDEMTINTFKTWTEKALKVYLSCRKKSTEGNFDELAARAFCAWEENLPVDETAELAERRLLQEYKTKLVIEGEVVPDPFSLTSGWEGVETGMSSWPSIYVTDISSYLNCSAPSEVVHRLLNEYKEGKAYRYFDSGWVKEVRYHAISSKSDKCFLQAKVTPSQSINKKNYDVWILAKKDAESGPGGQVMSAYCTCTAGMFGTCNHTSGVLFRVENAVKTGLTKLTATDRKCRWSVPKKTTAVKTGKVRDFVWTKANFYKSQADKDEEKEKMDKKYSFTPLSKSQVNEVNNVHEMRRTLYSMVRDEVPNSCFVLNVEKRRTKSRKIVVKPSLCAIADDVCAKDDSLQKKMANFVTKMQVTDEEVADLKEATIQQSTSDVWREQRKGRLTASNFQRVCSRVKTLKSDKGADPSKLLETILGRAEGKQSLAMKHGLALEAHAKAAYKKLMRKNKHKDFKCCDSGLSVFKGQTTKRRQHTLSHDQKQCCYLGRETQLLFSDTGTDGHHEKTIL